VETARHRREPVRPVRLLMALVKGAALGALLTLVVAGGLHAASPSSRPGATTAGKEYQRVVERAVAVHHCSYTGFGSTAVPASALIRTTSGELRQVSFEVGWDVYNGRRPGTLVAVCLDHPEARGLVSVND
jgi:hypothetical protein